MRVQPKSKIERTDSINNYSYLKDETGQNYAVNHSTGEITKAVTITVPEGTISYTPMQQEAYRKRKEISKLNYWVKKNNEELGQFFFVTQKEDFCDISPQNVARLIYLNTFVDYNNNRLMLTQRTPMHHRDLAKVLTLSKAAVSSFWQEVSPEYLTEESNGLIISNSNIFSKGKLKYKGQYEKYQKFYIDGIRTLYKATDANKHKYLGCVFKMLPFINFQYNILCYNPEETDIKKIETISLFEFCKLIGFDYSHLNRLLKIYKKLTFDVNGKNERFCSFVSDGLHRSESKIIVNPHILYNGTNFKNIEILATFCEE